MLDTRPGKISGGLAKGKKSLVGVAVNVRQSRGYVRCRTEVLPRRLGLADGDDPSLQHLEELGDPLRRRGWQVGRGVVIDVPGGVELVDRADQPDAKAASISAALRACKNRWKP